MHFIRGSIASNDMTTNREIPLEGGMSWVVLGPPTGPELHGDHPLKEATFYSMAEAQNLNLAVTSWKIELHSAFEWCQIPGRFPWAWCILHLAQFPSFSIMEASDILILAN